MVLCDLERMHEEIAGWRPVVYRALPVDQHGITLIHRLHVKRRLADTMDGHHMVVVKDVPERPHHGIRPCMNACGVVEEVDSHLVIPLGES
jgi:hypothetical protein